LACEVSQKKVQLGVLRDKRKGKTHNPTQKRVKI